MIRALAALGVLASAVLFTGSAFADPHASACADAAERGQELRDAHQLVEAKPQLMICAQRDCPGVVRASCTEWLADLDRRTPLLVAGAKDDQGHDLPAVTVSLDGAALPSSVTSSAVPVNPGTHVVKYTLAGYEPAEETVVLREGEPMRVLALTLRRVGAAGPVAPVVDKPERTPQVESPARPLPIVPIVLGGVSVVALSIFAYSGLTGASDYRRLETQCGGHCPQPDIDGVRSKFLVADIALVVGIVTAGAALGFLIFDRPASPKVTASQP